MWKDRLGVSIKGLVGEGGIGGVDAIIINPVHVPRQTEKLVSLLSSKRKLTAFDEAVRLPLNPSLKVIGLIPEECTLFKSALMPARLCFLTEDKQKYMVR